jgi:hypothetical protein
MDFQAIIVGIILLLATIYVGKMLLGKLKSFSNKNSNCGNSCGCETKSTKKVAQIHRN